MKAARCYLCGSADIPCREYSLDGIRNGMPFKDSVCICSACRAPGIDQFLKIRFRLDEHPILAPKAG